MKLTGGIKIKNYKRREKCQSKELLIKIFQAKTMQNSKSHNIKELHAPFPTATNFISKEDRGSNLEEAKRKEKSKCVPHQQRT